MSTHRYSPCPFEIAGVVNEPSPRCPYTTTRKDERSPVVVRAGAQCPYEGGPCVICGKRCDTYAVPVVSNASAWFDSVPGWTR